MTIDYALSNSFGFGGTNGTLLMKRLKSDLRGQDPGARGRLTFRSGRATE